MGCVPVALFVYNRIDHTKKTVEALTRNLMAKETDLFIFSDAARDDKEEKRVSEVRHYIWSISREDFKSITIVQQEKNKGLAQSIIEGVTQVLNKNGKVIVLEDDLVSSPYFLQYMNIALNKYEGYLNVYEISGYSCFAERGNIIEDMILPEHYFLKFASSWGWGTWKEKWEKFDLNALGWEELRENKELSFRFSIDGTCACSQMLINQMTEGIDSWAVKWWWTIFKNSGLTLFPKRSYVENIGKDGSGVHGVDLEGGSYIRMASGFCNKMPDKAIEKKWIHKRLVGIYKPSLLHRVENYIIKMISK